MNEEIKAKELKIEELATQLRCELEELSELVRELWNNDEDYTSPLGNELSYEEIQDYADAVNEIEQDFCELED